MNSFIENNTILEPLNKSTPETNSVYMNFTISFSRENNNQSVVEDSTEMENTTEADTTTEQLTTTDSITTAEEMTTTSEKASTTSTTSSGQLFQDSNHEEKVTAGYKLRGV